MVALSAALLGLAVLALPQKEFRLWEGAAPFAKGDKPEDVPTLTPYWAENPTGAAMVVCPGGGYWMLADHEGKDYALYLNKLGVHAFVLKYRLGQFGYRHPAMLTDAARAVRTVRFNSAEWKIDPSKIGIMGSSAGGHLASTLLTHWDDGAPSSKDPVEKVSSRPDAGVLCYAVISLLEFGHRGSQDNLLGTNATEAQRRELSNELHVNAKTPPCFVWHTGEDEGVPAENSMAFAAALRKAKVPFELHVYEKGGHGIGLQDKPPFDNVHPWARDLAHWLKGRGWANPR